MPGTEILHEVQKLYSVSDRLDSLAEQHPLVSEALITISGSVRKTATLLEVLVAVKIVGKQAISAGADAFILKEDLGDKLGPTLRHLFPRHRSMIEYASFAPKPLLQTSPKLRTSFWKLKTELREDAQAVQDTTSQTENRGSKKTCRAGPCNLQVLEGL
jgi:hypothetical protein